MLMVAVLFARRDSVYKTLPDVDVWDEDRDARKWPGGCPVVAHPPCRLWGEMYKLATKAPAEEKLLALEAIQYVRKNGGIVEHPKKSRLWKAISAPMPWLGTDRFGGWTVDTDQYRFGHRAHKCTRLYIVGCKPNALPPIPFRIGRAPNVITQRLRKGHPRFRSRVTDAEREQTPIAFALWLVEVAKRCQK